MKETAMDTEAKTRKEIGDKVYNGVTYRELDALDEKSVRHSLSKGEYGEKGSKSHEIVLSWLASKDSERADMNLSISRKALRNSKWATIIAIIAIIYAAKDSIASTVIFFLRYLRN